VLTAGALFAAPVADAAIPAGNLVLNPGAEDGPGATNTSTINPPPSWLVAGELTAVQYGSPGGFPSPAVRDSISGGANFFAGGNTSSSAAFQTIDVSGAAPEIDADDAYATLSGYLGGFESQGDSVTVIVTYQDQDGTDNSQSVIFIGPVTPEDRARQTTMLLRSASGSIPPGTRTIQVTLFINGVDGSYNDGYADNLSLTLHQGKPPPPPPPPPTMGETANAEPDRGTVRVRLPGSNRFVSLEDASQLPVGTVFDTTKGAVTLTTAVSDQGGSVGKGTFSGGQFVFQQTKKNPLTTLSMTGGGLTGCKTKVPNGGARKPGATAAAKRRRTLFSNVKGRFRTRGRHSAATVRGTVWRMTDTCKGTLTSVQKGSVVVRDFRLRKNRVIRAGGTYLARAGLVKKRRRG
jgi:hypothetical protein